MAKRGKADQWYWMPATVFLIGILSLILLFWVERISNRLHVDEMLVDAVMDIQIHIGSAHLGLEEIIRGEPEEDISKVLAELDQAIRLVNVILDGGESRNNNWISEPLTDPELRARADAIMALLIKFKTIGKERLQESTGAGKSSALYQQFHVVFREVLSRTRQLEESIEKDEAENQKKSKRLFLAITTIWALIVVAASAGLWNRERQRRKAEEELLKANEQLLSQAEELSAHREKLAVLVNERTAELVSANEQLQAEICEREHAEAALLKSEEQLRLLSAGLMTTLETERKNISSELHDELGHALTIMKLRLRSVERGLEDTARIKDECEDIMGYIDQTIENVRRLSRDLSPAILEDLGLTAAIRWLVENFNRNFEGDIALDMEDIDSLFSEDASIMIYRILQEALTNVGRHAQARNVSIVIRKNEDGVFFAIEDDGRGFNPQPPFMKDSKGKGMGLAIMDERVRILGGSFEITSQEGRGTRVTLRLPARKE